ncbi:MAG: hypothetical protein NTW86_18655 [Candidatus Sumerlaeota bacterium]|nr:hypothetical protein [Candidatus Sumerlaeota bacterium]
MNHKADSFLRLGMLMLKEAREQLGANPRARERVDGILAELEAVTNTIVSPQGLTRK